MSIAMSVHSLDQRLAVTIEQAGIDSLRAKLSGQNHTTPQQLYLWNQRSKPASATAPGWVVQINET